MVDGPLQGRGRPKHRDDELSLARRTGGAAERDYCQNCFINAFLEKEMLLLRVQNIVVFPHLQRLFYYLPRDRSYGMSDLSLVRSVSCAPVWVREVREAAGGPLLQNAGTSHLGLVTVWQLTLALGR